MAGGANGGGALFKLIPSTTIGGAWRESVPFSFGENGVQPSGNLVRNQDGSFFGTTNFGATSASGEDSGVVFQLTPPNFRTPFWIEKVLYVPPGVACNLDWPNAGLVLDGGGNILVTAPCGANQVGTAGAGLLFKLSPLTLPGSLWVESDLHFFKGGISDGLVPSGLLADIGGVFYGTTQGGGISGMGTSLSVLIIYRDLSAL